MNVTKKVIIVTTMQHATIQTVHSSALATLALKEMERIAKVTFYFIVYNNSDKGFS